MNLECQFLLSSRYWGVSSEHFILHLGLILEWFSDKGGALFIIHKGSPPCSGMTSEPSMVKVVKILYFKKVTFFFSRSLAYGSWVCLKLSIRVSLKSLVRSPTEILHLEGT